VKRYTTLVMTRERERERERERDEGLAMMACWLEERRALLLLKQKRFE